MMRYFRYGLSVLLCCAPAMAFAETPDIPVAENCLEWKIEQHPAASNNSSCAYFNTEKVSTRFLVSNSCQSEVNGVFTYFKTDAEKRAIMNVRHFAVKPGREVEVANPCNISRIPEFQVSQVSYSASDV